MCISMKTPPPPAIRKAPNPDSSSNQAVKARQAAANQKGVFGSIFTSALGDIGYGKNVAAA